MITCTLVSISDPPESGIKYAARFVCDGTQTAVKSRGYTFYGGNGNKIPLTLGQTYTASWWARCTEGSGQTRLDVAGKSATELYYAPIENLTSTWKRFTYTFTFDALYTTSDYQRIWFRSRFPANTAGTVEICGCKLVAGDAIEAYKTTIEQTADNVLIKATRTGATDAEKSAGGTTAAGLINVSPDSVKIAAKHVEIDGTATFNAIKSSADAAYDSKGSASAVQTNLDNLEVGGRNLLRRTKTYEGWEKTSSVTLTQDEEGITVANWPQVDTASWREIRSSGGEELLIPYSLVRDREVTLSCWFKMDAIPTSDINGILFAIFSLNNAGTYTGNRKKYTNNVFSGKIKQTTDWQRVVWTGTISDALFANGTGTIADTDLFYTQIYNHNLPATHVKKVKLEYGNRVTDWTPAPEDVEADINDLSSRATAYRGILASRTDGALVVDSTGFTLATGATISVYFKSSNNYAGKLTLNVNGTGAKDVWVGDLVTSDTNRLFWHWGSTITFTYDGTQWRVSESPGTYYGTSCSTAEATAAKATTIPSGVIFKGCVLEVPMTNANTSTSPSLSINNTAGSASNLTGEIRYGTGSTIPTKANGFSWLAGMSVIFKYDGKYWRTGNQTIIDGSHILTGTISADRIGANSITANKIAIGAIEEYENILLDSDAPTLTKVKASYDRYWSNAESNKIVCSNFSLTDAPEQGLKYGRRFVYDGSVATNNYYRAYAFYSTNGNPIPLTLNTTYTATWWARCTSGSGRTQISWNKGDGTETGTSSGIVHTLTTSWKKYTQSFTFGTAINTSYNRIWFRALFPKSTAGTVEICGCKLMKGGDAESYITRIDDNGIRIHPSSTENNSVVINGSGMEVFKGGTESANSVAKYGDSARVGRETSGHTNISSSGMTVYGSDGSVELANIGYGNVNSSSGTATNAPYFTFGERISTASPYSANSSYDIGAFCTYNSKLYICTTKISSGEAWNSAHWHLAIGDNSIAEGASVTASGARSHAEGMSTQAIGAESHAEGYLTLAYGDESHAEGNLTKAYGSASHAEGNGTVANGLYSHAGGRSTIANGDYQTVIGRYNIADTTSLFIVGNGESTRKNAFKIDFDGDIYPRNTKMVDFLIEQGTNGIWTYEKWSNGTYHAWYVGNVNIAAGTAMGGGYYHATTSALTPPTFSKSVTSLTGAANGANLYAYVGHAPDYKTYWWNGVSSAASNIPVRLDMYGTW